MERKHDYSFDLLRIGASVIVVLAHYQLICGVSFSSGINFYGGNFDFTVIVDLFLIISGYFMEHYQEKIRRGMSFRSFLGKRLLRLLPTAACAALGYEAVVFIGERLGSEWLPGSGIFDAVVNPWHWLVNSLGIQVGWGIVDSQINPPTWYISVLIWCYVVYYALTYWSGRLKVSPIWSYIGVIFLGFGINSFQWFLPFINVNMSRGYVAFFWGILLRKVLDRYRELGKSSDRTERRIHRNLEIVSILILLVGVRIYFRHKEWIGDDFRYMMIFFVFPAIIILLEMKPFQKLLSHRWIGALGTITFDVYMWHAVILVLVRVLEDVGILHLDLARRSMMLGMCVVIFALGAVLHRFVDGPFERWAEGRVRIWTRREESGSGI